jgi:U3 small nucleolar RNA-associated protein 11
VKIFWKKQNSRDFQKKRETIVDLKRKALERNPDEFYFNMTKTQFKVWYENLITIPNLTQLIKTLQKKKDGSHKLRNPFKEYTEDELKLMKSQDKNYIKFNYQMEMKVNRKTGNQSAWLII